PERQQIIVNHEIAKMVDEAEIALANETEIYQRGGTLCGIRYEKTPAKGVTSAESVPVISTLQAATVRELIQKNADFVQFKQVEDEEFEPIQIMPPDLVGKTLLARGQWSWIRPLRAMVNSPILRPDGSILQEPGYDPTTHIYFHHCGTAKQT